MTDGRLAVGLTGTGGLAPLEFIVKNETFPEGLRIDAETGIITGMPTGQPGEYRVEIHVRTTVGDVHGVRRIVLENP